MTGLIKKGPRVLLAGLFILALINGVAQTTAGETHPLLEKIQKAYRRADHLSFSVNYVYANSGQPDRPTDSLRGEIQLDGDRCRFVIDNTETIVTEKHAIRIMNEEKAIYLLGKGQNMTALPDLLGMTDSLLAHMQGLTISVQQQGVFQLLVMKFPPGQMYSRISLIVDPATGYLQQASYAIHTEGLVGKDMVESQGHAAPYQPEGVINVFFSEYEHDRFRDDLFDENQIFARVAGHYQPVGQYKTFHIFLASNNL